MFHSSFSGAISLHIDRGCVDTQDTNANTPTRFITNIAYNTQRIFSQTNAGE